MKNVKALVLFSGGLDSLAAIRVLEEQGIKVDAICFFSCFFGIYKAEKAARANGVTIRDKVDINKGIMELVSDPQVPKGKNLNPCIDCHSLMIKKAQEYVDSGEYDLLATGEVLGQRPFSQTKDALKKVEKKAGAEVLRPLSAQKLEPTTAENKGLVDRDKLLDIEGRSRKKQISLAIHYNLKEYESPSGGCLLTEEEFSKKLEEMFDKWAQCNKYDVELLKRGRVAWTAFLSPKGEKHLVMAVTGRKEEDNMNLCYSQQQGDIVMYPRDTTGPLTLVRSKERQLGGDGENEVVEVEVPTGEKPPQLKEVYDNEEDMLRDIARRNAWYKTTLRGENAKMYLEKKTKEKHD